MSVHANHHPTSDSDGPVGVVESTNSIDSMRTRIVYYVYLLIMRVRMTGTASERRTI
jgi:hypothetical protein